MGLFSKSDNKAFREIIETALRKDFFRCNAEVEDIIRRWKSGNIDNRTAYQEIYGKVRENDKYIAFMYDELRPSRYITTIEGLLVRKVLTEADLKGLSEEVRKEIIIRSVVT